MRETMLAASRSAGRPTLQPISSGGTLDQDGGTFDLDGTLNLSGNSTFNQNGGTLDFAAGALIDNGSFNYVGGTINGTAQLRNTTFTVGPGTNPAAFYMNDANTLASDFGPGHTVTVDADEHPRPDTTIESLRVRASRLRPDTRFTRAMVASLPDRTSSASLPPPCS